MNETTDRDETLASAGPGEFVCSRLKADGENAVRLKRLGICEGRTLEVVTAGNPMVLFVAGARIGLSRQLAELVIVK